MEKLQARNRCPIRLVGVGRQRHRGVRQVDGSWFGAHVEKLTKIGCGDPSEGPSDLSECTHLGGRVSEDEAAEFKNVLSAAMSASSDVEGSHKSR